MKLVMLLLLVLTTRISAALGPDPDGEVGTDTHGTYGSRGTYDTHGTLIQCASFQELQTRKWSKDALVLRSADGALHTLHNYTIDNATQSIHWTKREVGMSIERRGYSVTAPLLWTYRRRLRGPLPAQNPVEVFFCFRDDFSRDNLLQPVRDAICRWQNALGPRRGVEFVWQSARESGRGANAVVRPEGLCSAVTKRVRGTKPMVELSYNDESFGKASLGKYDQPFLQIGGAPYPTDDGYTLVSAVTKLLGRILGLHFEHQRPDASQHIRFHCGEIRDFYYVFHNLANAPPGTFRWNSAPRTGQDLTTDDFCQYGQLSLIEPFRSWWEGAEWVPIASMQRLDLVMNGMPFSFDLGASRIQGPFDFSSVMLTCGDKSKNKESNTLILSDLAGGIVPCLSPEMHPSAGDVAAVNAMYPPVEVPVVAGPSGGQPFGPPGPLVPGKRSETGGNASDVSEHSVDQKEVQGACGLFSASVTCLRRTRNATETQL